MQKRLLECEQELDLLLIKPNHLIEFPIMAQNVKSLPAVQETWVRSLGWEGPLEKGMAAHFSSCLENLMMPPSGANGMPFHDSV